MVGGSFSATGLMNALNGQQQQQQHQTMNLQQPSAAASPLGTSQQFCLKWNNHTNNLIRTFTEMISGGTFTDVTLACDGSSIKAHKMVLSACSNYFRDLFIATPCKHPIVILKDMKFEDLRAIIDFMYRGEVNVSQNNLGALLKTAEVLRVKGLTEVTDQQDEMAAATKGAGDFVSESHMQQSNGHLPQHHMSQELISQEHHALQALHSIATASAASGGDISNASAGMMSHSSSPISGSKKRKRVQTKKRLQRDQAPNSSIPNTVSNPAMVPPLPVMGHNSVETSNQTTKYDDADEMVAESHDISQAADGEEEGSQPEGHVSHGYSEEDDGEVNRENNSVAVSGGMYGSPSHAQSLTHSNHNMINAMSSMGDTPVSSNNGSYTMAQSPTGSRMVPRRMMMNHAISSPSTSSGVRDAAAGDCNSSHGHDVSNDVSSK